LSTHLRCYHDGMPLERLVILTAVFFLTSVVSVVTGSTSLITVPVMIAFGIEPHRAVATNMLALTFMSVGGSLPFVDANVVQRKRLSSLIVLTIAGSALGALLLLTLPVKALPIIIAFAMIAVAAFSLLQRNLGLETRETLVPPTQEAAGYLTTFCLAIYGGFFSGGYVTLLTSAFVVLFGMTFLQAVATTKVINVFSSAVATLVFFRRGVVDSKLGLLLGVSMFLGAFLGGRATMLLRAIWIRRLFVVAALCLAVKMLFFQS
jgi:uncharacterized protein